MIGLIKKVFLNLLFFIVLSASYLLADLTVKDFSAANDEQALFLRRLVEYWEEDKKDIVKNEIEGFLQKGDKEEFSDHLKALLGNIYFNEKKYSEAVKVYSRIENSKTKEKILLNYVQACWEVKYFEKIIAETAGFTELIADSPKDEADRFYFLIGDSYYQLSLLAVDELKQMELAAKSRPYIEKLAMQDYNLKPVLGHILFMLREYPEAAQTYLIAADKLEEQKEDLLFQAATVQINFNKDKAIETFSQVCQLRQNKVSDAALNKMVLLVELGRYNDLLLAKEQLERLVDKSKLDKFHFLFGKAYMAIQDYQKAGHELSLFLEDKNAKIKSEEGKLAIMMLFTAGEKEEEISFLDLALSHLENFYSDEENLPSAYFARALLNKKKNNIEAAQKDFDLIEKKYADFAVKEDFLMEAGTFYYEIADFLHSRLLFKTFVDKYKQKPLLPLAWRYFINSSIKLIYKLPMEKVASARAVLVEDLSVFLAEKGLLNKEEKMDYGLILAKIIYELEEYEESFIHLSFLFENYPKIQNKAKAQQLMGSLQQKRGNYVESLKGFEQALKLDADQKLDQASIHVNLFNIYLDLAKNESKYFSFAAEHLYQAQKSKNVEILTSNLLWLADYYYQIVENYMSADFRHSIEDGKIKEFYVKAKEIIDRLIRENYQDRMISQEKTFLENVLLKKAMLLGYGQDLNKQKELLLEITQNYEKAPDVNWENKGKTYFNLAKSFIRQNASLALEYLEKVISLNERSETALAAQLEKIRLVVGKIEKPSRTLENPIVCNALTLLKNMKAQKNVRTEPLHLEASLEYIEIATDGMEPQQQLEKKLDMLKKMKEDFTTDADVISKDYQNSLKLFPDKAKLVQTYLSFVEAEKVFLEAKLENKTEKLEKARDLYKKILKDNLVLTGYLDQKINSALEEIALSKLKTPVSETPNNTSNPVSK